MLRRASWGALICVLATQSILAQDVSKYSPEAMEREMAQVATSRSAVLVPMRDGVRLSTNIVMPRDAKRRLSTILWKTPYNAHKLRGSTQEYALEAVSRR